MNDEDPQDHARYWRQSNWMEQGRLVLTGDLPVDADEALRQLAVVPTDVVDRTGPPMS